MHEWPPGVSGDPVTLPLCFHKHYNVLMEAQNNPFVYGRPIRDERNLADRDGEKEELIANARSGQAVMLYAPRRYGKTSLARVVADRLWTGLEVPSIYVDLWGAASFADLVEVLGRAYAAASGLEKMRRVLADWLRSAGFEVSIGGVASVRYEAGNRAGEEQRAALRNLLEIPQRMAERTAAGRVVVILDEFGDVFNVPGEPDALMRAAFQASPGVSFLFMGSKRSLMDALFADRRRPFYNFGRRMELGRLPYEELGLFVEREFLEAGKRASGSAVDRLLTLAEGHPHRAQQLAYHAFNLTERGGEADEDTVLVARKSALDETASEFRAILDGMTPAARAVYIAVCNEPVARMMSRTYLERHGIKGTGSLRSGLRSLVASGDLEEAQAGSGRAPTPTDPLFAACVRERRNGGA